MADEQPSNPTPPEEADDAGAGRGIPVLGALVGRLSRLPRWRPTERPLRSGRRDLWQVPLLVGALALLALGVRGWIASAEPPDHHTALDAVAQRLDRQEYAKAIDLLNGPLRESVDLERTDPAILARFFALRADALYLTQRDEQGDLPQNNLRILENYAVAERKDASVMADARLARRADTLVSLDRGSEALAALQRIDDPAFEPRKRVMRRLIEKGLAHGASAQQRARAVDLLAEMRNEPTSTDEDRLWAIIRQTRLSLDAGFPDDAVRRLLPEIQRLGSISDPEAGELFVLLGRAYLEMGALDDARRRLEHAASIISETDELSGVATALLGRIDRAEGRLESARDRFAEVATRFPETAPALDAWIGLGEVEAELGHFAESLEAFEQAVFLLTRRAEPEAGRVERADAAMAQRHVERFEGEDFERALKYANLIRRLYGRSEPPPGAIGRLADTHRALAHQLLEDAPRTPSGDVDVFETDPATLEQARAHFARAGEHYARHAQMTLLGDPDASADSLWLAADSHDHAGDLDRAAELFAEYVEVRREDERRLEGIFRLARAHQARGEYAKAIELYSSLLEEHPTSDVAYRSYVPLAQSLLLVSGDGEADRAERLLKKALSGEIFTPDAPEFRAALVELGELYRRVGEHTRAIERLEEALERYPELGTEPRFVVGLADAHRLAALSLARELDNAMPQSERGRLEDLRIRRLEDALGYYERARDLLVAIPPARFGELHDVLLRNALLYRGDCAYDLGEANARRPEVARARYEQAIRYYDTAAQRYPEDPASLVAMIQIVNCYAAQGKWREVRTAHERARARLAEIPEGAFEAVDAPMGRRYWERWLDAALELDRVADAGGGEAGP